MSALTATRRRATALGAALAALALVGTAAITYAGADALWHSTGGRHAGSNVPELTFPATPIAALGGVDGAGALTSVTVFVVEPDGRGGTVVDVPVDADVTSGAGDERLPLAATVAEAGPDPEAFRAEVEATLAVSVDVAQLADAAQLTALLAPLAGSAADPAAVAAALTTAQPGAAASAWTDVADVAPDGAGPAAVGTSPTVESIVAAVLAGPVQHWTLRSTPAPAAENPEQLVVSMIDRSESALVFGQVAPGRTAAPNAGLSVRVEVGFSDDELAGTGLTNASIAYDLVSAMRFVGANVRSVDTTPAAAPGRSEIELGRQGLSTSGMEHVLGDYDVIQPTTVIEGIDLVLRPGVNYLAWLATVPSTTAATVTSVAATVDVVEPVAATTEP